MEVKTQLRPPHGELIDVTVKDSMYEQEFLYIAPSGNIIGKWKVSQKLDQLSLEVKKTIETMRQNREDKPETFTAKRVAMFQKAFRKFKIFKLKDK